jgi:hypothetical protein
MGALAGFLVRLVGYALVFGIVARVAEYLWVRQALDGSIALQPLHDGGITTLVVAPVVFALVGVGPLRSAAIFVAAYLIGAALTAPFALARFVGG